MHISMLLVNHIHITSILWFYLKYIKLFLHCLVMIVLGGGGLAHKLSRTKSVISDGILTEWLYKNNHIRLKNFVSINIIRPSLDVNAGVSIIFGNNFFEFGCFNYEKYKNYLEVLSNKYPNALYFPHPKEASGLPEIIFKSKLIKTKSNIETYCLMNGIPEHIIGFIGSTSIASIAMLAKKSIIVESIRVENDDYDGPIGNVTDPQLYRDRGILVTTSTLENTVLEIIGNLPNVSIKETLINLK